MSILVNKTPTEDMNFIFLKGFHKALFATEYKPIKYNDNAMHHGSMPVTLKLKTKRRDKIALKICIIGTGTKAEAMAKFQALHSAFDNDGYTTITADNIEFSLRYLGYTAFSYFGNTVTATLTFAEPNPSERKTV